MSLTFKSFLQFIEIQTKAASVTPFALGTLYSLYRYRSFKPLNFIIMFISLFAFDAATTAINNYIDYKKEAKPAGYNYESKNAIVRDGIKESTALTVIFTLLTIAIVSGIILTLRTNIIVLLVGIISFFVGIFYTFGPVPISRTPFGEIFSGGFMGFIITFLSIYVHVYDQGIVSLEYNNYFLNLSINLKEIFCIFLFSIPLIAGIANIMLANNICDVEEDIINKRYTLPYYIGREAALTLFAALYYIGFIDILVMVMLKFVPSISILALITLIPINKNIRLFRERPYKGETFVLSVKNFLIMNLSQILILGLMIIISHI
jgi:1,4-dihydroxy-2-naphthoate polyprenyltransferase